MAGGTLWKTRQPHRIPPDHTAGHLSVIRVARLTMRACVKATLCRSADTVVTTWTDVVRRVLRVAGSFNFLLVESVTRHFP